MGFLKVAALALLVAACSSTVEGSGDGERVKSYDLAVGATVTLVLGDPRCVIDDATPYVCLSSPVIRALQKAELRGDGALTIVATRADERLRRTFVDIRADRPGAATLHLEYETGREVKSDDVRVTAMPITHVDEQIACHGWGGGPTGRYPISRGSRVAVGLQAMNDATPLLSGTLDLIADRGGLEPEVRVADGENSVSRAVLSERAGSFTWRLAGERPKEIAFDIYEPESVGVLVTSKPEDHTVSIQPAVNDVPTCVYGGTGRAMTRVSSGTCRLLVGDYEVDGDLPVSLARGGETFAVEGGGACTVESRIAAGPPGSATVEARAPIVTEIPQGDAVGTEPLAREGTLKKRGACVRVTKISNGDCEAINAAGFVVPDGDCIVTFDWVADPYQNDKPNTSPVGVGLHTELRVGLKLQLFDFVTLKPIVPNALKVESGSLQVESLGCDSASSYEALAIRPPSAGMHPMKLTADNAPEPLVYDLQAKDVARIRFFRQPDDGDGPLPVVSQSSYHFVRSEIPLAVSYADSAGAALRGVAPVRVSTNDAAANVVLRGSRVFTGTRPNLVTLGSPATSLAHTMHVVDTSAVASVNGLKPRAGLKAVCVDPFAAAPSGQRILGRSPIRPRLSFGGGDACAIVGGVTGDTTRQAKDGELCASGVGPGRPTTEVRLAWGSATATWPCEAPPR